MSIVRKHLKSIFALALATAGIGTVSTADAALAFWDCKPTEIYEFPGQRIHVTCATPFDASITFAAIPVTDNAASARFISLASSAMLSGGTFRMVIDPAVTSDLPPGCGSGNCRKVQQFGLR